MLARIFYSYHVARYWRQKMWAGLLRRQETPATSLGNRPESNPADRCTELRRDE